MKRIIVIIISIVLLSSFEFSDQDFEFSIKIFYRNLPNPTVWNYEVNSQELKVFKSLYNPHYDSIIYSDQYSISEFDKTDLISYLKSVHWESLKKEYRTMSIDGFAYEVELSIDDNRFHFLVWNTNEPTLDSLLTICNEAIPKKNIRKLFKLN